MLLLLGLICNVIENLFPWRDLEILMSVSAKADLPGCPRVASDSLAEAL